MTYKEMKSLIESANMIQKYCDDTKCWDCVFCEDISNKIKCKLEGSNPLSWDIPKLTLWAPEDVALAKALKAFGAIAIKKWSSGEVTWEDKNGIKGYLPLTSFENLQKSNEISIDTIIKKAEE